MREQRKAGAVSWSSLALTMIAVSAVAVSAVLGPVVGLGVLGLVVGVALVRWSALTALGLLLSGPLLFSSIAVGPLTLDNVVTLVGLAYLVVTVFKGEVSRISTFAWLPLSLALAISLTSLYLDSFDLSAVLRFAALSAIPILIASRAVTAKAAERTTFSLLTVAAMSVVLQPFTLYPTPVIVEEGVSVVRYGGLFGHPNFASYCLAIAVIYLLCKREITKPGLAFIGLAMVAMLIASSLTALIALVVVAVVLVVKRTALLVALVGGGAIMIALFGSTLVNRLFFAESQQSGNSLSWRFGQWEHVLNLSEGARFFGVGWQQLPYMTVNQLPAHSAYIQVFAELGIVGSLLLLGGTVAALIVVARHRFRAAWIYVAVCSITDPVLFYPSNLAILLSLSAVALLPASNASRTSGARQELLRSDDPAIRT